MNELKKKIITKESQLQNGIYSDIPKATLNEWFEKWMDIYKSNLKLTTRELYTRYWNNYVRESNIGNMRIDRIKRVHIVELYKELLENKELATATVHTLHVIIYGCFEDLVQDNALQSNPAKKVFSRIGKRPAKKGNLSRLSNRKISSRLFQSLRHTVCICLCSHSSSEPGLECLS